MRRHEKRRGGGPKMHVTKTVVKTSKSEEKHKNCEEKHEKGQVSKKRHYLWM